MDAGVADLRGGGILGQLNGEAPIHGQTEIAGDLHGGGPAKLCIGADRLPLHEDDFAMTEIVEVLQREARSEFMIEDDIGDVGQGGVAGDQDGWQRERIDELGVDGENAINAAGLEQCWILGDEVLLVPVMDGEVEVAFFHQQIADAGEYLRVIALAEYGEKDADASHGLAQQRAGDHVGFVVEFGGGGANALAGRLWNRAAGRVIENE